MTTVAGPRASSGEETDDGIADLIEVLASSTMSSSPRPMSCPPELNRPPVLKKTKSSSFQSTGGVLIRERADDSRKLQERIEALLEEQDISLNSRVQFGLYLTSMIPRIHNSILNNFLDESHRLLLQYVRRSDLIMLQETQQQQQQQPYHPSHLQLFVKSTGPQVSAYPVSPLLSSPASQHHRSLTCGIASASCDSFTQQHMYSDHFLLFYFLFYSNL